VRSASAVTFDPVSHRTILFGGYDTAGYRKDTFLFDGQTWTQVTTPTSPSRRAAAAMSYDSVTQRVVLFGGFDGAHYLGDTWLWDGATLTWSPATPATSPTAVTGPMVFTDPLNGHVDCYGGYAGMFYQLKTWQWTGTTWVDLNPNTSPWARGAAVVATDWNRHKTVLFGGLGSVNTWNTWEWDGVDWQLMSPNTQPPNRYYSGAAYDPNLQSVVVYGGGSGGADLDDTWRWSGIDWEQLFPTFSPIPRESFGMTFDQNLFRVLVIGGEDSFTLYDETWQFDVPPHVAAYCTAGTTSHGCVADISGSGTPSASATSGFTISVAHAEGQKQGILFYGLDNTSFTPTSWGTGSSYLCVKPPTQRCVSQNSGGAINTCNGSFSLDWNAFIAGHPGALGAPFSAGQHVLAQQWFRDPPSPKSTSMSNALDFLVQP
jgi:hypothetical protein